MAERDGTSSAAVLRPAHFGDILRAQPVPIDRTSVKEIMRSVSDTMHAGLSDALVAAGQRALAKPAVAAPAAPRRNVAFQAMTQSAVIAAKAAATLDEAGASVAAQEAEKARRVAADEAAAAALLPKLARPVALRAAQFVPGAAHHLHAGSSRASYRFLRSKDLPPDHGAAHLRSILTQHDTVIRRLRSGCSPRSVVEQAAAEQRRVSPRRSPSYQQSAEGASALHTVAEFLRAVDVAPPLASTWTLARVGSTSERADGAGESPRPAPAAAGEKAASWLQLSALPPAGGGGGGSGGGVDPSGVVLAPVAATEVAAVRQEWEQRLRASSPPTAAESPSAPSSPKLPPAHLASPRGSGFTLHHLPTNYVRPMAAEDADAAMDGPPSPASATSSSGGASAVPELVTALRDLRHPPPGMPTSAWARAVFGSLEQGGLGLQLRAVPVRASARVGAHACLRPSCAPSFLSPPSRPLSAGHPPVDDRRPALLRKQGRPRQLAGAGPARSLRGCRLSRVGSGLCCAPAARGCLRRGSSCRLVSQPSHQRLSAPQRQREQESPQQQPARPLGVPATRRASSPRRVHRCALARLPPDARAAPIPAADGPGRERRPPRGLAILLDDASVRRGLREPRVERHVRR